MRSFSFLLVILASCTVPDKASLEVIRETKKLQKSPIVLSATTKGKVTDDKLELRENNSFRYQSHVLGTQKIAIYGGTFTKDGDTLVLHFQNDHKDSLWTNKVVIDKTASTITIISKDTSFNKQLTIRRIR